jgi:hypothetical protein
MVMPAEGFFVVGWWLPALYLPFSLAVKRWPLTV